MLKSVSPQLAGSGSGLGLDSGSATVRTVRLSEEQHSLLEAQFRRLRNPHHTDLVLLAAEAGLEERDVQMWYAQRLAAWKKEQGLSSKVAMPNTH